MPQASRSHPHSLLVNTAQPEGRNTKKPERETEPARRAKHNPARRGEIQPSPKGERICSPGREPGDHGPRLSYASRPRRSRSSAHPPLARLPTHEITERASSTYQTTKLRNHRAAARPRRSRGSADPPITKLPT